MEYHNFVLTADDRQFSESMQTISQRIAAIFDIPLSALGVSESVHVIDSTAIVLDDVKALPGPAGKDNGNDGA